MASALLSQRRVIRRIRKPMCLGKPTDQFILTAAGADYVPQFLRAKWFGISSIPALKQLLHASLADDVSFKHDSSFWTGFVNRFLFTQMGLSDHPLPSCTFQHDRYSWKAGSA